ncbi:MAG TPA: lysine--tRNA ligase [Candidatus Coprovivens excrementavium]|nr:lysine--tRNA ligase [Candidatus Coprovivens excrementavium]
MREFTEQELVRREKAEKIREMGMDPFGHRFDRTAFAKDIKDKYRDVDHDAFENMNDEAIVAGRIMFIRKMGKASFFTIKDKTDSIQIYISINDVGEEVYSLFKTADIGDIVGVRGKIMKTKTGEITIKCLEYTHLVKALRPLPEKFHGLIDIEERYRRRYVDLIMNDESKRVAFLRPKIIRCIQNYMDGKGFTEVETPILSNLLTGASARPFITHHNTQNLDMYLRIALELPLKRLLVGGMEAVYEIGRVFRNEGMDPKHNPEFTLMEAYLAYSDLEGMMDLTEGMYQTIAKEVIGKMNYNFGGYEISLEGPWKRISMTDAIKEITGIDFKAKDMTLEKALELAEEHHIEVQEHEKSYGHIVNLFFEKYVEETLIQPTFLYGHPIEISPLTKKNPEDPRFVDRFELFIAGKEFANAYTELNDPVDQLERFEAQLAERDLGNDEANDIDIDFVEALEYGMPPAGGIGYGIDRLCMLFLEQESIRDVLLFPTMKTINDGNKKDDESGAKTDTKSENAKIDLSKLKVEPLFEDYVDFETFSKSDFRVVKVEACEEVPKSKKLLKFILNDGTERRRTILSGIHGYYEPEELVGKTCVAITNLPPRKMMGIDSEGMLISAVCEYDGQELLNLLMLDDDIPAGAKLY